MDHLVPLQCMSFSHLLSLVGLSALSQRNRLKVHRLAPSCHLLNGRQYVLYVWLHLLFRVVLPHEQ